MIYDFKVSLDCINENPDVKAISILQVLEGLSSDNQILLIGDNCDENIYYNEDMKVFNEIMKYKID